MAIWKPVQTSRIAISHCSYLEITSQVYTKHENKQFCPLMFIYSHNFDTSLIQAALWVERRDNVVSVSIPSLYLCLRGLCSLEDVGRRPHCPLYTLHSSGEWRGRGGEFKCWIKLNWNVNFMLQAHVPMPLCYYLSFVFCIGIVITAVCQNIVRNCTFSFPSQTINFSKALDVTLRFPFHVLLSRLQNSTNHCGRRTVTLEYKIRDYCVVHVFTALSGQLFIIFPNRTNGEPNPWARTWMDKVSCGNRGVGSPLAKLHIVVVCRSRSRSQSSP